MTNTYLPDYFDREEESRGDWEFGERPLPLPGVKIPLLPTTGCLMPSDDMPIITTEGPMTTFQTGATRSAEGDKLDYEGFLSPFVLERYCQYLHKHRIQADGQTRTADNWQKGMPRARYVKSAVRHTMAAWKMWRQDTSPPPRDSSTFEDAIYGALFNWMGLLHEIEIGRDIKE